METVPSPQGLGRGLNAHPSWEGHAGGWEQGLGYYPNLQEHRVSLRGGPWGVERGVLLAVPIVWGRNPKNPTEVEGPGVRAGGMEDWQNHKDLPGFYWEDTALSERAEARSGKNQKSKGRGHSRPQCALGSGSGPPTCHQDCHGRLRREPQITEEAVGSRRMK